VNAPNAGSTQHRRVAYVLGRFPTLSETFVLYEIDGLAQLGMDIHCFSLYPCRETVLHERAREWMTRTVYIEPIWHARMFLAHLCFLWTKPADYLHLLAHHRHYGGKRVFWQAPYLAWRIKQLDIRHVHAHFAWSATDVAMMIARLLDISFSFSAHAADIFLRPERLAEKTRAASFVITCTRCNKEYLVSQYGQTIADKVHLVYHGVDTTRFQPLHITGERPIDILGVGRLVEKKGFIYLVEACRILRDRGLEFRCVIVGEGEERPSLESAIAQRNLTGVVNLRGALAQEDVIELYAQSKLFVLPCIVAANGDRDGLPNVLLEAMAMGLPVVSTPVSAIPELIDSPDCGLLVPPGDAKALAEAIVGLLEDNARREAMGSQARKRVVRDLDIRNSVKQIAALFERGESCR